jgi:hypothetical protein
MLKCHYAECLSLLIVMLSIVMLNLIMLSKVMLNVVMLSVVMLNVVAPSFFWQGCFISNNLDILS